MTKFKAKCRSLAAPRLLAALADNVDHSVGHVRGAAGRTATCEAITRALATPGLLAALADDVTMLVVLCATQRVGRSPLTPKAGCLPHPGSSQRLLTTSTMLIVLCAAQRVGLPPLTPKLSRLPHPGSSQRLLTTSVIPSVLCATNTTGWMAEARALAAPGLLATPVDDRCHSGGPVRMQRVACVHLIKYILFCLYPTHAANCGGQPRGGLQPLHILGRKQNDHRRVGPDFQRS